MRDSMADLVSGLGFGDHLCCIYSSDEERCGLLVPFIMQGVERGEKMLWIPGEGDPEMVICFLADGGFEIDAYRSKGQLLLLSAEETYLRDGEFRPANMLALWESEIEKALAEGYTGLRVAGEPSWSLKALPGFERLIEYEAMLNDFFPGRKAMALCMYDRRSFSPETLLGVLATHPIAIIGNEMYRNIYYIAPEELISDRLPQVMLDSWINRLAQEQEWHEEIEEKESRYRNLFNSISSGVAVYEAVDGGRDFIFVDYNRAGEMIDGMKRENVMGRRLTETFPSVEEFGLLDMLRRVWESGEPEYLPASPYGEGHIDGWRDNYVYKLPSGEIVAVYDDVTERVDATMRLMEAYRELDHYSGAVSHDLTASLTFIESFISRARKAVDSGDAMGLTRNLGAAESATVELEGYVDSLLRYARAQYSEPSSVRANTGEILVKILDDINAHAEERGVRIEVAEGLPDTAVDPAKLRQVFFNLLSNAVRYGGTADLSVEIGASLSGDWAIFYIKDNGVGIPEDKQALVFLPHQRLGREEGQGTGMGLSIVKRAVEAWGGRIWLESRPSQGCVFRFTAPLTKETHVTSGS